MEDSQSKGQGDFAVVAGREWRSHILFDKSWPAFIRQQGPRRLLIADQRLDAWIDEVAQQIHADAVLRVDIDEEHKGLPKVYELYEWLSKVGASRDVLVVALGGGVLTDVVGFAAATYLRGLSWAAIPTSLLAQVDASIGGKVGVNTSWGKNLVGAFHLPEVVAIAPQFLSTLPLREWRAGLGEILKSALIRGGWLYGALDHISLLEGEVGEWGPIIEETAKIKIEFVNRDLYESGPRMFLNLGHTLGHALENLLGYGKLTHGEAVGLGTLAALRISERLRGLSPDVRLKVSDWMERWGLPVAMPPLDFSRVWEQVQRDKKARSSGLTWVLLDGVGNPCLVQNVAPQLVEEVLAQLGF